jgi:hypothetical protein
MPKKPTYQHRWGLNPVPIDPEEIKAAVNVPGDFGINLNGKQKKRWSEIVSHLAWKIQIGAEPGQSSVDQMLSDVNAGLSEIKGGIEKMLTALETIQNPMIKRKLVRPLDGKKTLPRHLEAQNLSELIRTLKTWRMTSELIKREWLPTKQKCKKKRGHPVDENLNSAILNIGLFYREVTGKPPSVHRIHENDLSPKSFGAVQYDSDFLNLTLETLIALGTPTIKRDSFRNALGKRIERLKPKLHEACSSSKP